VRPVGVVAVLVAAMLLTGCQSTGHSAPLAAPGRGQVVDTLAGYSRTVLDGADPRLAGVPVSRWSYQVQEMLPGADPSTVRVRALLTYRLGPDPTGGPAPTADRELVVVADSTQRSGARVVSDHPVGAGLPWDLGTVRWSMAGGAAVLDARRTADPADDAEILAATVHAARAVTAVWGQDWRRHPVVVAVDDAGTMARLTGRTAASTAGLVAVTSVDRVYLDVGAWFDLPPVGRQVLITHEVTHLATRSAATDLPLWLEEGFADDVGLAGSGLPVRTVAAAALDPLRDGAAPPPSLPSDAELGAGGSVAPRAYAGAWLACRLLASAVGTRGLVAVYRTAPAGAAVGGAVAVDRALRLVTGVGTATWTQRWRMALQADVRFDGPPLGALA